MELSPEDRMMGPASPGCRGPHPGCHLLSLMLHACHSPVGARVCVVCVCVSLTDRELTWGGLAGLPRSYLGLVSATPTPTHSITHTHTHSVTHTVTHITHTVTHHTHTHHTHTTSDTSHTHHTTHTRTASKQSPLYPPRGPPEDVLTVLVEYLKCPVASGPCNKPVRGTAGGRGLGAVTDSSPSLPGPASAHRDPGSRPTAPTRPALRVAMATAGIPGAAPPPAGFVGLEKKGAACGRRPARGRAGGGGAAEPPPREGKAVSRLRTREAGLRSRAPASGAAPSAPACAQVVRAGGSAAPPPAAPPAACWARARLPAEARTSG